MQRKIDEKKKEKKNTNRSEIFLKSKYILNFDFAISFKRPETTAGCSSAWRPLNF